MATSADYTTPVLVNGYQCRNCTDVDRAKAIMGKSARLEFYWANTVVTVAGRR